MARFSGDFESRPSAINTDATTPDGAASVYNFRYSRTRHGGGPLAANVIVASARFLLSTESGKRVEHLT